MELDNRLTVCRLCLSMSDNLVGVFDFCCEYVPAELITELIQFEVSSIDIYPQCVCGECVGKLTDFKKFKQLCCVFKASFDHAYSTKVVETPVNTQFPSPVSELSPVPCRIEKITRVEGTVKQNVPDSSHELSKTNATEEVIIPDDFSAATLDSGAILVVTSWETSRAKDEAAISHGVHSASLNVPDSSHELSNTNATEEVIIPDDFSAATLDSGAILVVTSRETSRAKDEAATSHGVHSASLEQPLLRHKQATPVTNEGEVIVPDNFNAFPSNSGPVVKLNSRGTFCAKDEPATPMDPASLIPERDVSDEESTVDDKSEVLGPPVCDIRSLSIENSEVAALLCPDVCGVEIPTAVDKPTHPSKISAHVKNSMNPSKTSIDVGKPTDSIETPSLRDNPRDHTKTPVGVKNTQDHAEALTVKESPTVLHETPTDVENSTNPSEKLMNVEDASDPDVNKESDDFDPWATDDSESDFVPEIPNSDLSDTSDEEYTPRSAKRSKVRLSQSGVPGTSGTQKEKSSGDHPSVELCAGEKESSGVTPGVTSFTGARDSSLLLEILSKPVKYKQPSNPSSLKNPKGIMVPGIRKYFQTRSPPGGGSDEQKLSTGPSSVGSTGKEVPTRDAIRKEDKGCNSPGRVETDDSSSSSSSELGEDELMDEEIQMPDQRKPMTYGSTVKGVFDCNLCGKRYYQRSTFRYHMEAHKHGNRFKCETCGKTFDRNKYLKSHLAVHETEKNFKCDVCGKAYKSAQILYCHKKTHGEKNAICDLCGKKFLTISKLHKHLSNHDREKIYPCGTCGKLFPSKRGVVIHIKFVHLKQRTYNHCCGVCDRKFPSPAALRSHELIHTGVRPFVCSICGKGCRTKHFLDIHMNSHTKEKNYKCDMCEAVFSAIGSLLRHRQRHSGEMKYKCDQCGMQYTQSHNLKNHKKKKHHTDL